MRQNKNTWFYIGGSGLDRTDDFQFVDQDWTWTEKFHNPLISGIWVAKYDKPLSLISAVLADGEIKHKNGIIWHACVHGHWKDFFQGGALVDISKSFSRGGQKRLHFFLLVETRKTAFFAKMFKFLSIFRHPCLCVGKSSCQTIKNFGVISSILSRILNCEILLNLTRKMK